MYTKWTIYIALAKSQKKKKEAKNLKFGLMQNLDDLKSNYCYCDRWIDLSRNTNIYLLLWEARLDNPMKNRHEDAKSKYLGAQLTPIVRTRNTPAPLILLLALKRCSKVAPTASAIAAGKNSACLERP